MGPDPIVNIEAGMPPGRQTFFPFGAEEFLVDKVVEDLRVKSEARRESLNLRILWKRPTSSTPPFLNPFGMTRGTEPSLRQENSRRIEKCADPRRSISNYLNW